MADEQQPTGLVNFSKMSELEQIISASGQRPILLDFSASWCGPCRRLAPVLEKMSQEYPGVAFFKIDIDEAEPEIMNQFQVQSLPTVIIMVDRTVIFTMLGAKVNELKEALDNLK